MMTSRPTARISISTRKGPRLLSNRNRTATACSFTRKTSNRKKKLASSKHPELLEIPSDVYSTIANASDCSEASSEDEETSIATESSKETEDESTSATSSSAEILPATVARRVVPSLRPSYFPNVPPYMNFCLHDEKTEPLPTEIQKHLKWRLSPITPVVVKKTLANSGMDYFIHCTQCL